MFKWLKDRYNKYVNDRLIALYPKMHYRQRKKNAVRLAYKSKLEEINSHIYSYHKESTQWDSFQIRSKQLLQRSKLYLIREIKHYSKLKNLRHLILWQLKRINILAMVFHLSIKYVIRLASVTLEALHRFSHFVRHLVSTKEHLPLVCIDCGLPFEKRWRDPDNPQKHLICSIIGE